MNEPVERHNNVGASIGNVILGIWVIISPFVLGFTHLRAAEWNNLIVGLLVMVLASTKGPGHRAASIVNIILGAWLIASPFALGFTNSVPFWNNIILGIAILLVALVAASARTTTQPTTPPTH